MDVDVWTAAVRRMTDTPPAEPEPPRPNERPHPDTWHDFYDWTGDLAEGTRIRH